VPLLPASLTEPLWVEFAALIESPDTPEFSPTHPWGCHRRRVPGSGRVRPCDRRAGTRQRLRTPRQPGLLGPHHPPTPRRVTFAHLGPACRPQDQLR